ncbi:MAG TPA: PilZ domain-containing protein [Thermoanaerobaculia bacterium]|nr:PilZ domain-containing protein [Thermoanaerobaculia bacterium]
MKQDHRTGPRYFLNPPIPGVANGDAVRFVDVGARGCRLELRQSLEPSSPIEMAIGPVHLRGTVLWCQVDALNFASEYDGYLAGVAFEAPSAEMEHVARALCHEGKALQIEEMRAHDRYRITAPLTGSFGEFAPVSIIDVSVAGACIAMLHRVPVGATGTLRFQVDGATGPVDLEATVKWTKPSPIMREHYAGLEIPAAEEKLRKVIYQLCLRNEARIDIDSLKRKFDMLRLASRLTENPQQIAV